MVESVINTGYYNVRAVTYEGAMTTPAVHGGGLARIGDRYLLITGDGHLDVFGWNKDSDALAIKELPYRVPINGEEFSAAYLKLKYAEWDAFSAQLTPWEHATTLDV